MMHRKAKLLGKGIVEALTIKTSYLQFKVINSLTLVTNLIAAESRLIFACKNGDKHPSNSPFHKGLHAVESDHMTQYDVTSNNQQGRNMKYYGYCWCNSPTSDPPINFSKPQTIRSKTSKQKLATMNRLCVFGGSLFTPPPPGIMIKNNVKGTSNKGNILGEFDITEVEGSGGGKRRR